MSIKVLGVCATPVKGETNTEFLLQAILNSAKQQGDDVETEMIRLSEKNLDVGCTHCNWCLELQTADKFCTKNDDMKEFYPKIVEADALVLATPVYIGRISWILAEFIDRLRALAEGRYYGIRGPLGGVLVDKVIAGASVAWMRHGGVETALLNILITAGIFDMIPVTGGFGFGVGGVSAAPRGEMGAVRKDKYAMASAQTVGMRVVRVARYLKAGKQAVRYFPAFVK